jgi:hypothetical protein
MFFSSLDSGPLKEKNKSFVSKDNKMAEKFKMATKHEFAQTQSILIILIEILDFERTNKLKNTVELTFL